MLNALTHEFGAGDILGISSTFPASFGFLLIILYFLRPKYTYFKHVLLLTGVILAIITSPFPMVVGPIMLPNLGGITGIILIILGLKLHFQKPKTLEIT